MEAGTSSGKDKKREGARHRALDELLLIRRIIRYPTVIIILNIDTNAANNEEERALQNSLLR